MVNKDSNKQYKTNKVDQIKIKDVVTKDHVVKFDSYRAGYFYYNVYNINDVLTGNTYQFTVPVDDIGNATLLCQDKAITFMRWIRKAIQEGTLISVNMHKEADVEKWKQGNINQYKK